MPAVKILQNGLTAKGKIYMKGDIEQKPDPVLEQLAKEGTRAQFVKEMPSLGPFKEPLTPKKGIAIIGSGGMGDIITCLPALRGLKKAHPDQALTFIADECYLPLARNLDYIDNLIPYKPGMKIPENAIDLSKATIGYEAGHKEYIDKNRIEIYCSTCGIHPTRPRIELTKKEQKWGRDYTATDNGRIKVGIQYRAAVDQRTLPGKKWDQLYSEIKHRKDIALYIFHPVNLPAWQERDVTQVNTKDLRELAAIMKQMDLMIVHDSGLLHLAGALGVQILGLFGPSDPEIQCKYYPRTSHLWPGGKLKCAPCWHQQTCNHRKCFDMIKPRDIAGKVLDLFGLREKLHKEKGHRSMTQPSVWGLDFSKEIIYDSRHDQIGDLIAATTLFQFITEQNQEARISWIRGLCQRGEGETVRWSRDFNILDWIPFPVHRYYREPENRGDRVTIHSFLRGAFYLWDDMHRLADRYKRYPRMHMPRCVDRMYPLPAKQPYAIIHILGTIPEREDDHQYTSRRALDFKKYSRVCRSLAEDIEIVRVGAAYDSPGPISGIIDLTTENLMLNETLKVISGASLFIGGDAGLKLAASALGIPIIVEIDDQSRHMGGLEGCRPELLTWLKLGADEGAILGAARKILNGGENG